MVDIAVVVRANRPGRTLVDSPGTSPILNFEAGQMGILKWRTMGPCGRDINRAHVVWDHDLLHQPYPIDSTSIDVIGLELGGVRMLVG